MPDIATTSTVVKELLEIIHKSADIYEKLRATFKGSPEAKQEAIENKNELLQFKFNKFTESFSCKSIIGITNEKFEAFVVRLQKWYDLPDKIKGSILESLHANEDEGDISDFKFVDGKGIAYYARFVTIRNGQEMDVAYAVYTLDFEFPENDRLLVLLHSCHTRGSYYRKRSPKFKSCGNRQIFPVVHCKIEQQIHEGG